MTKEPKPNNDEQQLQEQYPNGAVLSRTYSGPIPPATEFAKYEDVLPGAANRILTMAEDQSKHRRSVEQFVATSQVALSILGNISALIIVLAGIAAGTYLILKGHSGYGLAAVITPIVSVVGAFLYREHHRRHDD